MNVSNISSREKRLLVVLGVVVFGIINFFVLQYLWGQHKTLSGQLSQARDETTLLEAEVQDIKELKSRDTWLSQQQKLMPNQDLANEQLLTKVQSATRGDVIVENVQFRGLTDGGHYKGMGMAFRANAQWKPLLRFLYELQSPENQVTFTRLEIKANRNEKSKVIAEADIVDLYQP